MRVLRVRWRTASIAAGWRFPSDWGLPEVDGVCAAVAQRTDLSGRPGRSRPRPRGRRCRTRRDAHRRRRAARRLTTPQSRSGLVATDPDAAPTALIRAAALAWADASNGDLGNTEATENLTSLSTQAYLRTRLGEVYRQATRDVVPVAQSHSLLVVTLDLSDVVGWSRLMAMVLVADVLRDVFDGGESVALLGPSVAVVLGSRNSAFGDRSLTAGGLITERLSTDPQLADRRPRLRVEKLPATLTEARAQLARIGRA